MLEHQDTGVSTAQDEPAAKAGKRPREAKDKSPKASAQDRTVPLIPGVEPAPAKEGAAPADRQAFLTDGLLALRTISVECGEATAAEMAEAHGWSESMAASICQQLEQRGAIGEARESRGVRWFSENGTGETRILALAQAGHVGTATWFAEEAIVAVRHAHVLCERLVQERKLTSSDNTGERTYGATYLTAGGIQRRRADAQDKEAPKAKPTPKGRTKQLSPEVKAVLSRCAVSGNEVRLPEGRLERPLYDAVNEALEALGGKWNRKAKAHVFASDPTEALAQVLDDGAFQKAPKDAFEFFPTPENLADCVAREAKVELCHNVLEPSAGDGALIRAVRRLAPHAAIVAVEIDARHRAAIEESGAALCLGDFLSAETLQRLEPYGRFDRVVMNPPFSKGQDIDHVWQAWGLLRPGGRLIAIMSGGTTFRSDRKATAFRAELVEPHGRVEELPEGSFKESGTGVRTVLVVLDKPEEATAPIPRTDAEKFAATAALVDGIEEALGEPVAETTPLATAVEGAKSLDEIAAIADASGARLPLDKEKLQDIIDDCQAQIDEIEVGKAWSYGAEIDALLAYVRGLGGRAGAKAAGLHAMTAAAVEKTLPLLAPEQRSLAWLAGHRAEIKALLLANGVPAATAGTYATNVAKVAQLRSGAASSPAPARKRGGKPPPEPPPPAPKAPSPLVGLLARLTRLRQAADDIARKAASIETELRSLIESGEEMK
jgi:hypothetical protein